MSTNFSLPIVFLPLLPILSFVLHSTNKDCSVACLPDAASFVQEPFWPSKTGVNPKQQERFNHGPPFSAKRPLIRVECWEFQTVFLNCRYFSLLLNVGRRLLEIESGWFAGDCYREGVASREDVSLMSPCEGTRFLGVSSLSSPESHFPGGP